MSDSSSTPATGKSGTGGASYDNTLGAILIGGFVSIFLYGVTCLQVFIYYQRYPRDKRTVKNFVYLIWAIDSFDAALTVQICYYYLVSNYANPLAISSPLWSLKLHVLITSVSDFIVRSLFVRRIYTLSHGNKLIAVGILVLSVIDLVVGIIITVRAFGIPTFAGLTAVDKLFYLNFATNIAADMTVAFILSYYLWINKTGSRSTDSLVVKLIIYTVNTGVITAIDALLGLICYIAMPTTFVFIAFYLNLSKFYVNSYLASLNVRKTLLLSMKGQGTGNVDYASVHLPHDGSPGVSQNMPTFRSMTATGLSVSMPESRLGYGQARIDLDLEIGTGTSSSHSKGDVSTAVNTPIDGIGALLHKGEVGIVNADGQRFPPGILVANDKHGGLDPESCYEAPTKKDVSVQAQQHSEKDSDSDSGSVSLAPID
ncbi:hypothetical protein ACEPAI_8871 [Sanghuangporus weigelae]